MFIPSRVAISNITQANPAVVTTSTNHNMTTGQVVRVNVPKSYGMVELNHLALSITVLSNVTFSLQYEQWTNPPVNVNTTGYTAFTIPSGNQAFTAEILPIGSGPTPVTGPEPLVLRGTCVDTVEDATNNQSLTEIPY